MLSAMLSIQAQQKTNPFDSLSTEARQIVLDGYKQYEAHDYAKATQLWEKALPMVPLDGKIYETLLNGLALMYDELQDNNNGYRIMQLMEEHNQRELLKPCDKPDCMIERAHYYGVTGNLVKAKECYQKAFAMPMDDDMKIKADESYAEFMYLENDKSGAADYLLEAANIYKSKYGEDDAYSKKLYKSATFSQIAGKYDVAIELYSKARTLFLKEKTRQAADSATLCLKGLGATYSMKEDYATAIRYCQKVLDYYEETDTACDEYPKAILDLAKEERFANDYQSSVKHLRQAMPIFEQRGMLKEYSDAAGYLQRIYNILGIKETVDDKEEELLAQNIAQIDEMISATLGDLQMERDFMGKSAYAESLGLLGGLYASKGDRANSIRYYRQYIDALREAVREEFRMENESERMKFWSKQQNDIEELLEHTDSMSLLTPSLRDTLCATIYDAELLAKGILLNSSIEFEKVLSEMGDAKLTDTYKKSKANDEEIQRLRLEAKTSDDLQKILELTRENNVLQLQLYKGCAQFADFTNYISYRWQDVQKALQPTDIAIEFAACGVATFASEKPIMAFILTKDMTAPEAVLVEKPLTMYDKATMELEHYTDSIIDNTQHNKTESLLLQNFNWKKLSPWLQGKKRIFFSADGTLNRRAIEYMDYNGRPLSDQFEVYRLSSTKELCYNHKRPTYSKAALFGDINYNNDATVSSDTRHSLAMMRGADGFANLDNTRREIDDIAGILKGEGVNTVLQLRDTEASRTAFLSLNGSKVNILHIATHGMYKDQENSTDADAMRNSLLAFAGANIADDGLVTAADIASMDLRQCDLAVLSACETGLGKLGGDGVFGLQRGFKNAGVHTLLMSLRNVYDSVTADMMVSFYRYLSNGHTKREALVKAQQDIRNKGYTDPKYWATFILLDAF